ncbi:MAG: hypothetical protein WCA15_22970 [Candidatus Acidiferrales bacterium]
MSLILKSIEEEADDCRAAWKGFKVGTFALHCHHETLAERLTEDAENRVAYILSSKPRFEQALRLRLFRPVSEKAYAERDKAFAERDKAFAEWEKAEVEWEKADAEWEKAFAELEKADAELEKADAELEKAYAERDKAYVKWDKADAEWDKANANLAILVHTAVCKDCPWDGKTIFPKENQ